MVRALGEGQAGVVWLARSRRPFGGLSAGAAVAVKRYRTWLFEEPGRIDDRIFAELHTWGLRIQTDGLVRTLCLVADPDRLPALVMQFYDGPTLEAYLEERSRRGCEEVVRYRRTESSGGSIFRLGSSERVCKPLPANPRRVVSRIFASWNADHRLAASTARGCPCRWRRRVLRMSELGPKRSTDGTSIGNSCSRLTPATSC